LGASSTEWTARATLPVESLLKYRAWPICPEKTTLDPEFDEKGLRMEMVY
jgi:hypothetical protein